MNIAQRVVFGGGGLERLAHLRGDEKAISQLRADPRACVLPIWRGKALFAAQEKLCYLSFGHAVLDSATEEPVLIGEDKGAPVFAIDISGWEPDLEDDPSLHGLFDYSEQRHPALPADHGFLDIRLVMTRLSALDAEIVATATALLSWHRTHQFCSRCGERSKMEMSGWKRQCVSCRGSHFPRTDPVVIMLITHGNDVLVGRSHGWPKGMYSLLAGFIEPGETIEAAARREVAEEAGVRVGRIEYLASQPWAFPNSLMIGCRGEATSRDIEIDPEEIEDAKWVSREEMTAAYAGERPDLLPARPGAIAHYLIGNWLADRFD